MISLTRRTVTTALTVLALGTIARDSGAQVVPYKASGTGLYSPITGDYSGPGVGTHLGLQTYAGHVTVSLTANPFVFDFEGTQESTSANGDKLYFSLSGQVELIPLDPTFTTFTAVWTGEFVVEG